MKTRFNTIERFVRKIDFHSSPKGCWLWKGSFGGHEKDPNHAYGRFWLNPKNVMAHRFSYEYFYKKKIPENFQIDHLCCNPKCVNPNHFELVSLRENMLRAKNPISSQAYKTHCKRGHLLSGKNLHVSKDGHRRCLTCVKLRTQNFRKTGSYTLPDTENSNHFIWKKE
jgi:hypothetical protein